MADLKKQQEAAKAKTDAQQAEDAANDPNQIKEKPMDGVEPADPNGAGGTGETQITRAQELGVENDVIRKMKRERGVEGGGVKLVREKVPFIW